MSEVLILGNGISRLLHDRYIASWTGEIWGCNRVFEEREIAPRLSVITGHKDRLITAAEYREAHGYTYVLYGMLDGESEKPVTVPGEMRKDSGTTLVAQALEDGYEQVHVCGFDIGGPDIYSPINHMRFRKTSWVRRWRAILTYYGTERVYFVGHDHTAYLLDASTDHAYMKLYRRARPHIQDPDYLGLYWLIYGIGDDTFAAGVIARMSIASLRKVATMRGIDHQGMRRAELCATLRTKSELGEELHR